MSNSFTFTWDMEVEGVPVATDIEGRCYVETDRSGEVSHLDVYLVESTMRHDPRVVSADSSKHADEIRAHLRKNYRDRIDACARDDHSGRIAYDREMARAS
jgi:hypothetical protein